jgi:NitT/TauT family transport system permease protein/taurine transport system permease protein
VRVTRRAIIGLSTALAVVGAWFVATLFTHLVSPGRFPSPPEVFDAARQIATTGYADATLLQHALRSLRLVLMGFAVAVCVGVPLGLAMGASRRIEAFVTPVFLIIRPIPPLAWIPLAILWLGLGDAAKIMVIFFAAFVPAVINTHAGVRAIEPHLLEASRVMGAGTVSHLRDVLIPGAAPMIFTGLRLSMQASWTTLVAAELIGALAGLGRVLNVAQQDIYPAMILVGMAAVAVLGWATTRALAWIEIRSMPWLPTKV